jgi:CHAD domain-containing protein
MASTGSGYHTAVARVHTRAATAVALAAAATTIYEHRARGRRRARRRRYRFGPDAPLGAEIRRVLNGQFDLTIEALAQSDSEEGVHEARKSLKRLRALIRLLRVELGDDRYARVNAGLRDAGRSLAAVRDAAAIARVLETLVGDHADVSATEVGRACERLRAAQARAEPGTDAEATVERLNTIRRELAEFPIRDELDPLLAGLRRSLHRGRRAARAAREQPTTEQLHAWRKRVKDLRHDAELLRDADPKRLRSIRAQARELADVLGEDHDLGLLSRVAADCPTLVAQIARRRAALRARAFELGQELYARPPRRVVKRVRRRAARGTAW